MTIQAEVSLYPLRTLRIGLVFDLFLESLCKHKISMEPGSMSSRISGEASEVFAALYAALMVAMEKDQIVLIVKASNACPLELESP